MTIWPVSESMWRPSWRRWSAAIAALAAGLLLNYAALALSDRHAGAFPAVHDIVLDQLPFVDLYKYGEVFLSLYLLAFLVVHARQRESDLARLFMLVGVFYACRSLFMLTLPIGAPLGATPVELRNSAYPFASHSYFPSGHLGLMFVLALSLRDRVAQRAFMAAAIVFGVGTLLTKAHYTADLLGAFLIAYAVSAWGDRLVAQRRIG